MAKKEFRNEAFTCFIKAWRLSMPDEIWGRPGQISARTDLAHLRSGATKFKDLYYLQ